MKRNLFILNSRVLVKNILRANLGSHQDFEKTPGPPRPSATVQLLPSAANPQPSPDPWSISWVISNMSFLALIKNKQFKDLLVKCILL